MHKANPAVYACPKGKGQIHTWFREGVGAPGRCLNCKLVLSLEDTAEVFQGEVLGYKRTGDLP